MNNSKSCLDCGTQLEGVYCHNCGQKDIENFSLKTLFSDFINSFFSIDSKLFVTLKHLLFNPGFLTKEYWKGRRSRYISPVRLYLVTSFIMFIIMSLSMNFLFDGKGALFEITENDQLPEGYEGIGVFISLIKTFEEEGDDGIVELLKNGIKETQRREITAEQIFFSAIPTSMFILMPIFAVLLYLILFRKKELSYVHHLITVLHLHSTVYMFLLIFIFLEFLGIQGDIGYILWPLFACLYLVYFLKKTYEDSWIKIFIKSSLLASIYISTFVFGLMYLMFFALVLYGQPS